MAESIVTKPESKEEKAHIEVRDPVKFEGVIEANLMSTSELIQHINGIFRSSFNDYDGCAISVAGGIGIDGSLPVDVPPNGLYVDLFFRENPNNEGGIKNLLRRGQREDGSKVLTLAEKYALIYGINSSSPYIVTQDTYDCLNEFSFHPENPKWEQRVHDGSKLIAYAGAMHMAHVRITSFDLNKIVGKIFGTKDANGNLYQYSVTVSSFTPDKQFLLNIARADCNNIKKLAIELTSKYMPVTSYYTPCR